MGDRIPDGRWREPIGRALDRVEPWRHLIGEVRFVAGVDPVFAGLHSYASTMNGWTYGQVAHACYPHHLTRRPLVDRIPTVVLPIAVCAADIVHELGHVFDYRLGEPWTPAPVSEYARTNRAEAFAEFFVAHLYRADDLDQDVWAADPVRQHLDALRATPLA